MKVFKTRYGELKIKEYVDRSNTGIDYMVSLGMYMVAVKKEENIYIFTIGQDSFKHEECETKDKSNEDIIIECIFLYLRNKVIEMQNMINMIAEVKNQKKRGD